MKLANTDFADKIIIDVANAADFTAKPPIVIPEFANTNSLAESIQNLFPKAKVVKSLNTLSMALAVNPRQLNNGDHTLFVAGNDDGAKTKVKTLLTEFGWDIQNILDLGDVTASRVMESHLVFFVRASMSLKSMHNIKIISA